LIALAIFVADARFTSFRINSLRKVCKTPINERTLELSAKPQAQKATSKPHLAGGNTINQALKPSRANITLPGGPGLNPSHEEFEKIRKTLDARNDDLLRVQDHMKALSEENRRLVGKMNQQARVLARYGVSDNKPVEVVETEAA
jgi:hypothetical protein